MNWILQRLSFINLGFANDIFPIASSEQNLEHNLNMYEEAMRTKTMTINSTKPKTVVKCRQARQQLFTTVRSSG